MFANREVLNNEKSRFLVCGPRPARRARSPNSVIGVPFALMTCPGSLNAAGLKNPFGPGFGKYMDTPGTELGTLYVVKSWPEDVLGVRISVEKPLSSVSIPLSCHPPKSAREKP